MIYLLTAFSVLISLLRNGIVVAFDDELMNAMLRSAQNHKFEGMANSIKNIPAPRSNPRLRALDAKDKPSPDPKPDPKPKPSPPVYMAFSNHIDDLTCGDRSRVEAHGYLTGHCFTGKGGLAGLHWSFTPTSDSEKIYLNYGFYVDPACSVSVLTDTEAVTNGCEARGEKGGHGRSKKFYISPTIPDHKDGPLFNGYETLDDCKKDDRKDILIWSYVKNNACDPQISSPVYGDHVTDETRTCKKDKIVATLYDSNDLTCSGAVTTTTNVGASWECLDSSVSGAEESFVNPRCV